MTKQKLTMYEIDKGGEFHLKIGRNQILRKVSYVEKKENLFLK